MVHNTYAVLNPTTDRLFATYHIYFGDPDTGERSGFMDLAHKPLQGVGRVRFQKRDWEKTKDIGHVKDSVAVVVPVLG